jgi:ArsR family transcriptional regulator, cadmium/lead-responsive transcriptional repressor
VTAWVFVTSGATWVAHGARFPVGVGRNDERTSQHALYIQHMLNNPSRLGVMNRLGRAMADPNRSSILMALLAGPSYPGVLAAGLGLTRSNVSNHLTCLRGCGIVVGEPEGRRTRYEIADPRLAKALAMLIDVTLAADEDAPCLRADCPASGCDGGCVA